MKELNVLITLAGGLGAALVLGYIAHRLKLSPIVGYLLAGIAIGPFTPGLAVDPEVTRQFAEIGVILLLFGIGLRFQLRELVSVWPVAVPGALIQSSLSAVILALLLYLLGWSWSSGLILGLAISVASTVVMATVLAESHDLHAPIGNIAIGWTVVEDLITVIILLFLPIIFGPDGGGQPSAGEAIGSAAFQIIGMAAVTVGLGRWVIPWFLEKIESTRSRELFTLAVLVLAVGIAIGSAMAFGLSMALGAFLAGLAVGRSEFAARAAGDALPMRDAFAVLFFVSIGMLFDPRILIEAPLIIAIILIVVLIGKPLIAMATVRLLRKPSALAIPVGAAFSQVGEFSFILGTAARDLGLINDTGWSAMVAAAIISIGLNPSIYRWARRFSIKAAPVITYAGGKRPAIDPNRCILIGYGPVGKIVYRLLSERGAAITVVELNLETVRRLRADGHSVLYSDVLRSGTLNEAGVETAGSLILSADIEDAAEIIRQALILNPDLLVLARCSHLRDASKLYSAGAAVVAAGEAEVAVALAEAVTADDKVDHGALTQQRANIRRHLYDSPS